MNPELHNEYPNISNRLPRVAGALAAGALLLTGCSAGETDSRPTVAVTQSAEASDKAIDEVTQSPDTDRAPSPSAGQTSKPSLAPETPHQQRQKHSQVPSPQKSSHSPASTPAPKAAALIFKVTGSCHFDGELQNWSKNFTPYGSTFNQITEPDGTAFTPAEGLLNDGYGHVDGLGHSQWSWACEAQDQDGYYKGIITDLGPDNILGTPDDRSTQYAFNIVKG